MNIFLNNSLIYFNFKLVVKNCEGEEAYERKYEIINLDFKSKNIELILCNLNFKEKTSYNSIEILKDIIKLGKFISENINEKSTINIDEANLLQYTSMYIDEAWDNNKKAMTNLINEIYEKYGQIISNIPPKSTKDDAINADEYIPYSKEYNITSLLAYSFYIFQISLIIYYLANKKLNRLCIINMVDAPEGKIKNALASLINDLGSYKIFTTFDEKDNSFKNLNVFSSLTDVCFSELRKMLFSIYGEKSKYYIGFCKNCGDFFVKEHGSLLYCGKQECISERNRLRQRKWATKKEEGRINNGNN